MQKCSLCGGKVVNGRCEDCGMPIPPENRYTLRSETVHTHEVNGEKILHRVRQMPDRKPAARPAKPQPRRTPAHPYQLGNKKQDQKAANRWLGWIVAIVIILSFFSQAITSLST